MTPLDPNELRNRFSPLLDGELMPDEQDDTEKALADDAEALRELHQMQRLDAMFRELPKDSAPDDLENRIHNAIHRPAKPVRLRSQRFEPKPVWPMLAAAAMLLVVLGGVFFHLFTGPNGHRSEMAEMAMLAEEQEEALPDKDPAALRELQQLQVAPEADDTAGPMRGMGGMGGPDTFGEGMDLGGGRDMEMASPSEDAPIMAMESDEKESYLREHLQPDMPGPRSDGEPISESQRRRAAASPPPPPPRPTRPVQPDQAAEAETRVLGGRAFQRDPEAEHWQERGYAGEGTQPLQRDDPDLQSWLVAHPEFEDMLTLTDPVVFRMDGIWRRLEPASE